MIRINLLPVRASKKKESAKQQVFLFVLGLIVLLVALGLIYSTQLVKIKLTNNDIERSEKELARLKTVIGEIDSIKKLQDDVKKKLDVLNRLRKEKTGPSIRLAKLSDMTPEKLWLTKYTESGSTVSIGGIAYNEDILALFLRNLQASDEYANVELLVSEQTEVNNVKTKRFDISCTLKSARKEEPAAKAPK
jgi:type IV pilus assembly protein PilN